MQPFNVNPPPLPVPSQWSPPQLSMQPPFTSVNPPANVDFLPVNSRGPPPPGSTIPSWGPPPPNQPPMQYFNVNPPGPSQVDFLQRDSDSRGPPGPPPPTQSQPLMQLNPLGPPHSIPWGSPPILPGHDMHHTLHAPGQADFLQGDWTSNISESLYDRDISGNTMSAAYLHTGGPSYLLLAHAASSAQGQQQISTSFEGNHVVAVRPIRGSEESLGSSRQNFIQVSHSVISNISAHPP